MPKAKLETVAELWESFRAILPPDAPAMQVIETRRAFYAACCGMLSIMRAIGNDDVSEEVGVAHLESMARELVAFQDDLRAGRA